jgi:hypothetical protein
MGVPVINTDPTDRSTLRIKVMFLIKGGLVYPGFKVWVDWSERPIEYSVGSV